MNPTTTQVEQLRRDNASWPRHLKTVPIGSWPPSFPPTCFAVWRSRRFLVQAHKTDDKSIVRLSVNRTDWDTDKQRFAEGISWDELQELKLQAGYGDFDAVEVFPRQPDVVNVANMRHLFVFLNERLPFAWRKQREIAQPDLAPVEGVTVPSFGRGL